VDGLNSSLAQSAGELRSCKVAEHLAKKWRLRNWKGSDFDFIGNNTFWKLNVADALYEKQTTNFSRK